jgi:hypothetical protein
MNVNIVSLSRIEREATLAAQLHVDVNYACPYPFHTGAGCAFRTAFLAERNRLLMQAAGAPEPQPKVAL